MFQYFDLTERFPMRFNLQRMKEELEILESKDWLSHYDVNLADGWTTIPLVTHDGSANNADSQRVGRWGEYKRTSYVKDLPYFSEILNAFKCPHGRIRIMKLMPGTEIRIHRDTFEEVSDYAFGQVRLHVPIVTNGKVVFTVAGKDYHLSAGRLHYVNFSKKHYVRNDGDEPRTHLVLDLKVNDFLRDVFPPLTSLQKLQCMFARVAYPIFVWVPIKLHRETVTAFWRLYNDSFLQRLRHLLFPRKV